MPPHLQGAVTPPGDCAAAGAPGHGPARRNAEARNEKASHEPIISTADQRARDAEHRKSCGCKKKSDGKHMLFYTADGKKMFPSMRPWMISH